MCKTSLFSALRESYVSHYTIPRNKCFNKYTLVNWGSLVNISVEFWGSQLYFLVGHDGPKSVRRQIPESQINTFSWYVSVYFEIKGQRRRVGRLKVGVNHGFFHVYHFWNFLAHWPWQPVRFFENNSEIHDICWKIMNTYFLILWILLSGFGWNWCQSWRFILSTMCANDRNFCVSTRPLRPFLVLFVTTFEQKRCFLRVHCEVVITIFWTIWTIYYAT